MNLKWIINPKGRSETMKLLEESIEITHHHFELGNTFLDITTAEAQTTEGKNRWAVMG